MAKYKLKSGLAIVEFNISSEIIETEHEKEHDGTDKWIISDGTDKWIVRILKVKPERLTPEIKPAPVDKSISVPASSEINLPEIEEIAGYIISKPNFEHDIIELQNQFLKRRVKAREEKKLFTVFEQLIKEARELIAKDHHGIWGATYKHYGGREHASLYKFTKTSTLDAFKSDS